MLPIPATLMPAHIHMAVVGWSCAVVVFVEAEVGGPL